MILQLSSETFRFIEKQKAEVGQCYRKNESSISAYYWTLSTLSIRGFSSVELSLKPYTYAHQGSTVCSFNYFPQIKSKCIVISQCIGKFSNRNLGTNSFLALTLTLFFNLGDGSASSLYLRLRSTNYTISTVHIH
jgi:hypothetical protein